MTGSWASSSLPRRRPNPIDKCGQKSESEREEKRIRRDSVGACVRACVGVDK